MTESAQQDGLHPNTFQTPNLLVDRLLELLTDNELRIALFTIRHIYGWKDTRPAGTARLSISSFEHGYRGSRGCGLARGTIVETLASLERLGIMHRVGNPTRRGRQWAFAEREKDVDWAGLELRKEEQNAANRERTEKARAARRQKREALIGLSDRTEPVCATDQSNGLCDRPSAVCATDRKVVSPTDHIETDLETKIDDDLTDTHHQDFDARTRELLAARFERVGIAESVWSQWVHYSPDHLLACILHAQAEGSNPPGLLRTMLDGDGVPLPKYLEQAQRVLYPEPLPEPIAPDVPPAVKTSGLDARIGERDLTVADVWQAVTGQLKLQLNSGTFDTYVRDAQLVRYEEGTLWVMPRYNHARPWYESQAGLLEQLVTRVAGIPVAVRCATNEAGPAAAL